MLAYDADDAFACFEEVAASVFWSRRRGAAARGEADDEDWGGVVDDLEVAEGGEVAFVAVFAEGADEGDRAGDG